MKIEFKKYYFFFDKQCHLELSTVPYMDLLI